MDPKPLPVRPSLEQYRKQAKKLLKLCRSADAEAMHRVRANHPRFNKLAEDEMLSAKLALADAQLVIAREHGFESWLKFAKRIKVITSEIAAMSLDNPVAAFIEAAIWHGTLEAAEAILAAHPKIARSSIHAAAILGDDATVRRFISLDPRNATSKEKPYDGDALVYLCLSKYLRLDKARSAAFVRTAAALLDAGADPNTGFWSNDEHREFETALYGAAGVAHHAELTRLLLQRGADPNDDNAALRVLVESGKLNVDSLTTMLLRKADMHDYEGMKYLLEHAADPNRMTRWHHTALHQALRRDNALANIGVMLDHGADPTLTNLADGRSGVAMASRRGRGDVLASFVRREIPLELYGVDRLIVACAMNDAASSRDNGERAATGDGTPCSRRNSAARVCRQ
jgi:ankyrin repeat protein